MQILLDTENLIVRARRKLEVAAMTETDDSRRDRMVAAIADLKSACSKVADITETIWAMPPDVFAVTPPPEFDTCSVQAAIEAEQPRVSADRI